MNDLDIVAESLADKLILEQCGCGLHHHLPHVITNHILNHVKQAREEGEVSKEEAEIKAKRDALFDALFTAIKPYEEQMKTMLRRIWKQEQKIVIANLKKMKKAWLRKDAIDNILYPQGPFVRKISDGTHAIFEATMESEARRTIEQYELGISFDVENPEVQKWIKSYTMKFAKELEATSHEALRRILSESLETGEGIPQITKKILGKFEDWAKYRAEMVARSEILRASNRASLFSYIEANIEKKEWLTGPNPCVWCDPLGGTIIATKETFFNIGDDYTVVAGGKKQTLHITYENVETPPLHPRCVCAISPWFPE